MKPKQLLALALLGTCAFAEEEAQTGVASVAEEVPFVHHPAGDNKACSPYADRDFPARVFFGDTHHHTSNSGDAFMGGNRLTPEQAYRFARGEEVTSPAGIPAKLSRPLDFLVISDHAEGLGVMDQMLQGNPDFMKDEVLVGWNKAMKAGGEEAAEVVAEVIVRQVRPDQKTIN